MAVRSELSLDALLAGRALTREDIDQECSKEILEKIGLKMTRWKIFCPFIGITPKDEEVILKGHRKNSERKMGMLEMWKERFGKDATYLKLAIGFESAKLGDRVIDLLDLFVEDAKTKRASQRGVAIAPKLGDTPKPKQLIKLIGKSGKEIFIRDAIADDWEDLFMQLNFEPSDESGSKIEEIRMNTHFQTEDSCREVLLMWLSGGFCRKPVTWETLIEVLKDVKQDDLAKELEEELN